MAPAGPAAPAAGEALIAAGHNERVQRGGPVAHGETACLRGHGAGVVLADDERCVAVMGEFQERFRQVWSEHIGCR